MRIFVCIIAAVTSINTLAADINGTFAMKGAGLLPCGVFTSERDKGSEAYYLIGGWVEGYVSAHNKLLPNTYDITTFESLELLLKIVDVHCKTHPDDVLHGVVDGMITKLAKEKISLGEPKVMIGDGDKKVFLYRHTIRKIQQKLRSLELYKGPVNGVFSDATRAALRAFQSDIQYTATGFPDQATLWKLLR